MPIEDVAIIPVHNVEQILLAPAERVLERQRQTRPHCHFHASQLDGETTIQGEWIHWLQCTSLDRGAASIEEAAR